MNFRFNWSYFGKNRKPILLLNIEIYQEICIEIEINL